MTKKYIWSGNKCRDYWSCTYYSARRLRGGKQGIQARWTTLTYRRTAIHGLSATEAALIVENDQWYSSGRYHSRGRPDGLVDLFHIKCIKKSIKTETVEMRR